MSAWFRAAKRVRVPRWAVGVAVATPVAATVQGAIMLQQYRNNHGHAPHPISPSQGLVVVSSKDSTSSLNLQRTTSQKPLRLLVVGDSLAVGVGTSQSGTPILPQSIARALSGASHGRAVHWTCIGTVGGSSSQIVYDLGAYEGECPSLLERKHVEWQVAKEKAREWWEERKKLEEESKRQEEANANKNRIKLWWSRVQRDVKNFREAMHDVPKEAVLQTRLTRRKTTLDHDAATQYDIAVVITGINDLKDAWLPFMMKRKNPSANNAVSAGGESSGSMKDSLVEIVRALQSKMKLDLPKDEEEEDEPTVATLPKRPNVEDQQQQQQLRRGPLIVFPGLPASPLPLTHYPPLSWFLIPLLRMMDNNKKLLAEMYPGIVLYVDPPSPAEFREFENGGGQVHDSKRTEQILLQLTNVTQRAREKVEELMDQHYRGGGTSENEQQDDDDDERLVYGQGCRDHQLVETKNTPGATLLAADRLHPNDEGYDFWARHIAAAIVREWKQEEN